MWKIKTTIVFIITFLVCSFIGLITVQNRINAEKEQLERIIVEHSYRIYEVLSKQLYKTQALTAFIIKGDGTVENFQQVAAAMSTDVPALANFLLAPGGVVTDVFPLEGNEAVLGLDFFNENNHAGNREAILARDKGDLVMAGPFELRQGGLGLTGRYPVYLDNGTPGSKFWGLVSVSLKFPEALDEAGLSMLDYQGLSYELWRINPDTNEKQIIVTNAGDHQPQSQYIEKQIIIHHAEWYFRVFPLREWYEYPETWLTFLIVLTISLFIAIVVQKRYDATARAARFREATEAKSKFLAMVSHEIRTPMNVIIGVSELELENETLLPDVYDSFDKINNSSRMLLGIINDLLDLSKIETGKLELLPVNYSVADLIYDTVRLNVMLIGDKPINLVLNVSERLPSKLFGDDRRIKQILNNFLSNAIKYTSEGTVTLTVNCDEIDYYGYASSVGETERGDSVAPVVTDDRYDTVNSYGYTVPSDTDENKDIVNLIFTIEDTGQGVTKDQLATLFDEYSMFNSEKNRNTEGTGLGMSITKKFVDMIGGRIDAESTPGVGSKFTVYLPQMVIDGSPIGKELAESLNNFEIATHKDRAKTKRMNISNARVLVVDDMAENIYIAKGLMKLYGINVDTASSGYETVVKVRAGNIYDIIFLDHMMPEMDGVETLKLLREEGYKNPVVALTANAVAGMREVFLSNGFDDYMPKPFSTKELDNVLRKFIHDKESPHQGEQSILSQLKEVPFLDVDSALRAINGMEDMYIDTLKITAGLLPERIEKTNRFAAKDIESFSTEVHGLKSVLANIGANTLSYDAAQLEQAALDNDTEFINNHYPIFKVGLSALSDILNSILQPETGSAKETADKSLLAEIIPEVKAAVEAYDSMFALELLSACTEYSYDIRVDEVLRNIVFSLEASDYDSAISGITAMEDLV